MQEAIQNVATEGGLDSFPEETKWQIRLLLPNLQPDNPMNELQPLPKSDTAMPSLLPVGPNSDPSSSRPRTPQDGDARIPPESSGFRLGKAQILSCAENDNLVFCYFCICPADIKRSGSIQKSGP